MPSKDRTQINNDIIAARQNAQPSFTPSNSTSNDRTRIYNDILDARKNGPSRYYDDEMISRINKFNSMADSFNEKQKSFVDMYNELVGAEKFNGDYMSQSKNARLSGNSLNSDLNEMRHYLESNPWMMAQDYSFKQFYDETSKMLSDTQLGLDEYEKMWQDYANGYINEDLGIKNVMTGADGKKYDMQDEDAWEQYLKTYQDAEAQAKQDRKDARKEAGFWGWLGSHSDGYNAGTRELAESLEGVRPGQTLRAKREDFREAQQARVDAEANIEYLRGNKELAYKYAPAYAWYTEESSSGKSSEQIYQEALKKYEEAEAAYSSVFSKAQSDDMYYAGFATDDLSASVIIPSKNINGEDVVAAAIAKDMAEAELHVADEARFKGLPIHEGDPGYDPKILENGRTKTIGLYAIADRASEDVGSTITLGDMSAGYSMLTAVEAMKAQAKHDITLDPERVSEDEYNTWLYLLGSKDYGIAYADEYALAVNDNHARQQRLERQEAVARWFTEDLGSSDLATAREFWRGVAGTVYGAVAPAFTGVFDYTYNAVEYAATGDIREKSYLTPMQAGTIATSAIADTLNRRYGTIDDDAAVLGGKGLGDLYQVGESIIQSWASIAAGGEVGSLAMFFFSAGAQGIYDALDRGIDPGKAITLGTLNGLAEVAGEVISVEGLVNNFFTPSHVEHLFLNVLKQAGYEGSEEVLTSLLNGMADEIVNRDKSELKIAMQQYLSAGMSYEEASKQATKDFINSIASDALSGALSGFAPAALGAVKNVSYKAAQRAAYNRAEAFDSAGTIAEAKSLGDSKLEYQAKKAEAKGPLTNRQQDRLERRAEKVAEKQNAQSRIASIENRLTELGESGNVHDIAVAIDKKSRGENLDRHDLYVTNGSKNFEAVIKEISDKADWYTAVKQRDLRSERETRVKEELLKKITGDPRDNDFGIENKNATVDLNGSPATLVGLELGENDNVEAVFRMADGIRRNVQLEDAVEALPKELGEFVHLLGGKGAQAPGLFENYQNGQSVGFYLYGMENVSNVLARAGVSKELITGTPDAPSRFSAMFDKLTPAQIDYAYKTGSEAREAAVKAAKAMKSGKRNGTVSFEGGEIDGVKYKAVDASKRKGADIDYVSRIAKTLGVDVVFFQSEADNRGFLKGANGAYKNGVIYLDINAGMKKEAVGERVLLTTMAHELTHYFQDQMPEKYEELKKYISEYLLQTEGVSFNSLVASKVSRDTSGTLTKAGAIDEVIADACETMLRDSTAMEQLAKENPELHKSLIDFIRDFLQKILDKITGVHAEAKALEQNKDVYETVQRMWDAMFVASAQQTQTETEQKKTPAQKETEGKAFLSARDALNLDIAWDSDNTSSLKSQLQNHLSEVSNLPPVTSVEYDPKKDNYVNMLVDILKNRFGFRIKRQDVADILFDDVAISTIRHYVSSDEEAAAVIASPYILKRGKIISGHKNHKNRGYPSLTFAGTAKLNGETGVVAVAAIFESKNRVHSLRVLSPNGTEFVLGEKVKAESEMGGAPNGVRSSTETASKRTIPQSQQNSNTKSQKSDRDISGMATLAEEHFGITKNAKESGYITVNGNYLDFSGRHWGSKNSGSREVDHADVGEILPDDFDTYAVFRNGTVNRSGSMSMWEFEKYGNIRTQPETGSVELAVAPTPKQQKKLMEYFKAMRSAGKDITVSLNNLTAEGKIYPAATLHYPQGVSYEMAVLDILDYYNKGRLPDGVREYSDSIKNSWMFSERDAQYDEAVNSGNMDTAQRLVDEAAKEAGYTVRAYHGTPNGTFTVFRGWQYFTPNRQYADVYQNQGASSNGYKKTALNPKTYDVYINLGKVFDTRKAKERRIFQNEFFGKWGNGTPLSEKGLPDWTDADDIIEFFEENDYNYDTILIDEGATGGYGDEVKSRGISYVVKSPSQIKSHDAIVYDDSGNIVPLSERFNSDREDIRFSERETDTSDLTKAELEAREMTYNQLKAENAMLKRAVDRWKRETKLTKERTVRQADANKLAKETINRFGSQMDPAELAKVFKQMGDYLVQTDGADIDYEFLRYMANDTAKKILDINREIDNGMEGARKDLGDYLKGQKLFLPKEYFADMGDISDFRKRYKGVIRLAQDGLAVDVAYQELTDMLGEGFFPSDISNPADQLQRIADVWDSVQPTYGNPFQKDLARMTEELTQDIIWDVISPALRETAPTYADKAKAREAKMRSDAALKLQETKEKDRTRLEELRAEKNERIEQLKKQASARLQAAVAKEKAKKYEKVAAVKEHYQEMERRAKERRKESAGIKKYKTAVEKKAKALYDMLNTNTDKLHVPEALKKPLAELLSTLNFESTSSLKGKGQTKKDQSYLKQMENLRRIIANQNAYMSDPSQNDGLDVFLDVPQGLDKTIQDHIDNVRAILEGQTDVDMTSPINEMSSAELQDLDFILTTLTKAIKNINTFHTDSHFAGVIDASKETTEFLNGLGEAWALAIGRGKAAEQFLNWSNTLPYYAFKRFGEAGRDRFNAIAAGWSKMAMNAREIIDFSEATYNSKEAKSWEGAVHEITIGSTGTKVQMTTAQIMALYCLAKREQAMGHLMGGGMRIGNIDAAGTRKAISQVKSVRLTLDDVTAITGLLTDRQIAVADALQHYMAEQGQIWGNEVSMERFGYRAFNEANYFPIVTDSNLRPAADPEMQKNDFFRLLNISATKALTPNANNALVVGSIFDVFSEHMADMAKYNALALPILDMLKWYNYNDKQYINLEDGQTQIKVDSVQMSTERAFGKQGQKYMLDFIKDLNGVREGGRNEEFLKGMMGRYKGVAVAANIRVALQQPTSIVRAALQLNPGYLVKGAAMSGGIKEAMKYSGLAVWKDLGYFDTNIARNMRDQIKHTEDFRDKVLDKSMKLAEMGDKVTWGAIWNACKLETMDKTGLTGEALLAETAKRFDEVILSTQVIDSTISRSDLMRSSSMAVNEYTSFMSEPTVTYNALLDVWSEFMIGRRSGDRSRLQGIGAKAFKTIAVYFIASAATAAAAALADAARDDDDYETWAQKWLEHFWENFKDNANPIKLLPLISDIYERLVEGDNSSSMLWAPLQQAKKAFDIGREMIGLKNGTITDATKTTNYGKMTTWGFAYNGALAISYLSGLPIGPSMREFKTLWNSVAVRFGAKKLRTYDPGAKSSIKYALRDGYITEEDAQRYLIEAGVSENKDDAYWMVQGWAHEDDEGGWSKYMALHNAALSGDAEAYKAALNELTDNGMDEKSIKSNMKSQIHEWYVGNDAGERSIDNRADCEKMLIKYAGLSEREAKAQVSKWNTEVSTPEKIRYDEIGSEFIAGNISQTRASEMLQRYGGVDPDEADSQVLKWKCEKDTGIPYTGIRNAFETGEITESKAISMLKNYGGKSETDAEKKTDYYKFVLRYPNMDDITDTSAYKFFEVSQPAGISAKMHYDFSIFFKEAHSDYDENGKTIKGSAKKDKVTAYIDGLNISDEQKDVLYGLNYSTGLSSTPWHK